jgi:hypothetical protein
MPTTVLQRASGSKLRRRSSPMVLAVGAALLLTCTLQGASAAGPTLQALVPTSPYRILDTRNGTGAPVGTLGPGATLTLQVAGVGPVPANASAVIINLTATGATGRTFITAWPTGTTRATTSVLNATPGVDIANMITASLGDGRLDLYNNNDNVHLVADIAGYIAAGPAAMQTTVITGYAAHYDSAAASSQASGCMRVTPGTTLDAQVDLGLPAGASITGVRVRYTSSAVATPINLRLMRTVVSGSTRTDSPASDNLVTITSSGPGSSALTLTNVGTLVSDTTYYWLDIVSGPFATGFLEFCGVSVDYTTP